jgi:hypothetical protein
MSRVINQLSLIPIRLYDGGFWPLFLMNAISYQKKALKQRLG